MRLFVVGTRDDVAGFALAGIEGIVCATRDEAVQAITRADDEVLVVVSPEFAAAVPRGKLAVALPVRT